MYTEANRCHFIVGKIDKDLLETFREAGVGTRYDFFFQMPHENYPHHMYSDPHHMYRIFTCEAFSIGADLALERANNYSFPPCLLQKRLNNRSLLSR